MSTEINRPCEYRAITLATVFKPGLIPQLYPVTSLPLFVPLGSVACHATVRLRYLVRGTRVVPGHSEGVLHLLGQADPSATVGRDVDEWNTLGPSHFRGFLQGDKCCGFGTVVTA